MTRLIVTGDSSAAGGLKQADLADIAIRLARRLVWGPLPSETELAAFFEARTNQEPGLRAGVASRKIRDQGPRISRGL